MTEAGEQATGTKDENYDLISVLYHCLQGSSVVEQYIQDAHEAGEQELVAFFRDYQEAQRDLAERAKNLLGARLMRTQGQEAQASSTHKVVVDTRGQRPTPVGAPTKAQVRSGGPGAADVVDEQSKESFPASDAPAKY